MLKKLMLEGRNSYCTASTMHSHLEIILQCIHAPASNHDHEARKASPDKVYDGGGPRCMPGTGDMKPPWWPTDAWVHVAAWIMMHGTSGCENAPFFTCFFSLKNQSFDNFSAIAS